MQIRQTKPKYEKEYYKSIAKIDERIPVYENFCIGDTVYYEGKIKAIIYKNHSPSHIEIIFDKSYHKGLIDKNYIDKILLLEENKDFVR